MASLRRPNGNHFCGSSIIGDLWVLSAAHCTEDFADNGVGVVAGSIWLNNRDGLAQQRQSVQIINHPEYNRARLTNDISVVRINQAWTWNANVRVIDVGSVEIGGNVAATVIGWGVTQHQGSLPESLQYLPTRILTNADCRAQHNVINRQFVHDNVICSLNDPGQGMCSGDSGGALIVGNTVVGVPSWVIPCGVGFPDAYARVSSHRTWIRESTGI